MATRDDALRNVFLFIRDTNTGRVTRTVIPGDLQIGLRDNPASLELGGKLAIKVTDYTVNAVNKGIINVMPEDTVVSVNIDEVPESNEVQIILPANPTKGEIHFIKDVSGQASSALPIKVLPQGNVTIDGAEEKEIIDAFGSLAVFWFRGLWRVLVSGVGLATAGTAPINSAYVTIGNDATLTNERRVAASSNIGFTDGGANSSVSFDLTDTGVAATTYTAATVTVDAKGRITAAFSNQLGDANAEYIVASATGSLPNAKTLVAGPNITINDEGTQLSITGSASGGSGTGDGDSQARYVVTEETGSLPNAYRLVAGPNIIINSGSGLVAITGSGGSGNSVWSDVGDQIFTTASVAIGIPNVASSQGTDIVFFVSGAISGTQKAVFGGDVRISGTLVVGTGSIHIDGNEIRSTEEILFPGAVRVAGGFTSATGSISSSLGTNPSTLNLSTEGTLDWFAPGGVSSTNYRASTEGHGKRLGGWIHQSFDWSGYSGMTSFTQASTTTISSDNNDDHADTPLSSVSTDQGYFSADPLGLGYRFRVPADTYTRVLRIYGTSFAAGVTLTAKTRDGEAIHIDSYPGVASTTTHSQWTITYNSERDGQELLVELRVTADQGGTPNLKFIGATLARS